MALSLNYKRQHGIANFEVSRRVNEDVLWLEVAVDNVQWLEVLERQDYLTGVELRLRLTATTRPSLKQRVQPSFTLTLISTQTEPKVPNSTTRTPATDMLYNTTNGHHQRTRFRHPGNTQKTTGFWGKTRWNPSKKNPHQT